MPSAEFLDASREWRRIFAEWWGTLLLVVSGAGACVSTAMNHAHPIQASAAVVPGLTVMVVIYFMGTVSGAHLNPVVTLAFALRRNFPWKRVPGYIAAPDTALTYPWKHFIGGHMGRLGSRDDVATHRQYMADIADSSRNALDTIDPTPYFVKYGENTSAATLP